MPRESRAQGLASNRLVIGSAVLFSVIAGATVAYFVSTGPRLPPTARVSLQSGGPTDESLASICEPLSRDNHLPACRAFVHEVNAYLGRHPKERPPELSEAERARLKKDLGLDEAELTEIDSDQFTPLDAHHLEACFLLRDAARGLELDGVSDRDRARLAFAWVTRQVQLRDPESPPCPPLYVLRRGWGSAWERSLVFFSLLDQLGIPACLVTCPADKGTRFWLAGAVVGEDVLLFEPRLGVPLPGPGGKDVATFAQVRRDSELLTALNIDQPLPYDVTPAQAQKAEASPTFALSTLAPRMRRLQEALSANNAVHLAFDAKLLGERYPKIGVAGHWGYTGPDGTLRLLRTFLTPDEGGSDQPPADARGWMPRVRRYRATLTPRDQLPTVIHSRGPKSFAKQSMQEMFERGFESFVARPDSPRDAMLRGRPDLASARLVSFRDQLSGAPRPNDPKLTTAVEDWCAGVERTQAEVVTAKEKVRKSNAEGPEELKKAQEQMDKLWSKKELAPVLQLIDASATPPLRSECAYLLALCKHEEAERGQALLDRNQPADAAAVRAAWRAAADSWDRFRAEHPDSPREAAARLLGARALEALGERDAALALVQDPPRHSFSEWDRRACLYRARLLKNR